MPFAQNFISLADLYLAYRKAKAEAFYAKTQRSVLAFTDYEQRLEQNLAQLLRRIKAKRVTWFEDLTFLGGYFYIPKSVEVPSNGMSDSIHYRAIDPFVDWDNNFNLSGGKPSLAKYRLMISPTVNFQILSALWILKVGHLYESVLDNKISYGNRLRHLYGQGRNTGRAKGINEDSLGLFQPYFSAYNKWRENGLRAMRDAIENGDSVDAITMDLASFYHKVDASFLVNQQFLDIIDVQLSEDEYTLTNHLISAIHNWYKATPDYSDRPQGALPVGLSASKLISNVLLYQLDKEIHDSLNPLYYGRYVDDIFLVLRAQDHARGGDHVVSYIANNVNCISLEAQGTLRVSFGYAKNCDLLFSGDKQKIFCLTSKHGLDLVDHIAGQIRKQSSEYRLLSDVPDTGTEMAARALLATPSATLEADALRKADVVSVRRLGFALLLGDVESYAKDLQPKSWLILRSKFYGLVYRHLLTPQGMFNFFPYYSRVFSLMVSSGDFDDAEQFVVCVKRVFEVLASTTTDGTETSIKINSCKRYFAESLVETSLQSSTARRFLSKWNRLQRVLQLIFEVDQESKISTRKSYLLVRSKEILLADLGIRPYKDYWYYTQKEDADGPSVPRSIKVRRTLRLATIRKFREMANLKMPHWPALAFPTRPLTVSEIGLVAPDILNNTFYFRRVIWGLRGARVPNFEKIGFADEHRNPKVFSVPSLSDGRNRELIRVGLTSVKTTDKQWKLSVTGEPDRSLSRYKNIIRLINRVLKEDSRPDYVVFPELSIPRRWAFNVAHKLAKNGISLIAGIEYYPDLSKKTLKNDCIVSLSTKWPGYNSSIIWIQPKFQPAHGEKRELKRLKKTMYLPNNDEKKLLIYDHGGYYFGVLICSDLTNISYRSMLQGKIDTLFVLEWNPDIETFGFLVEGAAHDLHSFIVQVNNRTYGDSRIRAPYKEDHKRDLIQIKGGISDFYVLGDIDYLALRKFHNTKKMPKKPLFKPLPIGFKVAKWRKN